MTFALFLSCFAHYLYGLCGTVPAYRDSGDLIASIHTLGIAHPPGYAFYVVAGKLFECVMPFGNVAYRVNVFSALCAAGAVAVLYALLRRRWGVPIPAAMAITVMLAVSPAMVALARAAEMYALAAFMAVSILYFVTDTAPESLGIASFLLGLGLSVHPTLVFLVPLFVAAYRGEGVPASRDQEHQTPTLRYPVTLFLWFCLGLSVFLYLPLRAMQDPLVNWGDPSNWRNFWRVVTRADYGGLKLHPEQSVLAWTPGSIYSQLAFFAKSFLAEWGWGAGLLGLIGVFLGLRHPSRRGWTLSLLGAWIFSGPAFYVLSNLPPQEATTPAILQPYLLLAGVLWAPLVGGAFEALRSPALWVLSALLLWPLARRPMAMSQRQDFYIYDYARNILRSLPAQAVLFDPDDQTRFSIQVIQKTEHRRDDVALLNFFRTRWGYEQLKRRLPDLLPPIPIESGQELEHQLWTYSARRRPFFAELPQKLGAIPYRAEGLVYAADMGGEKRTTGESFERAEALFSLYVMRGDYLTTRHPDFFTRHVIDYYAAAHCNLGLQYAAVKAWDKAVAHYRQALAINPTLSAAFNDWGVAEFQQKHFKEAADLFAQGLQSDPGNERLRQNRDLALQKMPKLL